MSKYTLAMDKVVHKLEDVVHLVHIATVRRLQA